MLKDLNFNGLRYFEAVVRLGKVSQAADELQVTTSAVSQQIRLLEQQFGVLLFRRRNRRLIPTEEGERLYNATSKAFRLMTDVQSAIVRQPQGRQFIMRASPSFGELWLGPRIKSFLDQNPNWAVRVDATPDFSDFETEIVDLDLRYGKESATGYHEVPVMQDFVLPMCSPDLLEKLRDISDDPIEQIRKAQLIDSAKSVFRWDLWLNRYDGQSLSIPPLYQLRFDRSSMAIQLAADGAGIALESAVLAWQELSAGQLVPLSPEIDVIAYPAYSVICPPRHTNRQIVRLFTEWAVQKGMEHMTEIRAFLKAQGCRIVHEDGPASEGESDGERPARPEAPGPQ